MSKKIVFILGMHRSGTSAMAGCMHLCGISGGGDYLAPSHENKKGYFENQRAVEINDNILSELGLAWDSSFSLPEYWMNDSMMQKHASAIRHFLTLALANNKVLFLKDPRLCYLLPLWQTVANDLGVASQYVIMLRHYEEIYRSLQSRNEMAQNKALTLWINHILLAEKYTRGHQRIFVKYNDLLRSPALLIENILRTFQLLPEHKDWENKKTGIADFIDKKLKNQQVLDTEDTKGLATYSALPGYFNALAKSGESPEILTQIDNLREDFLFNLRFFAQDTKYAHHATLMIAEHEQARMVTPLKIPVYEGLTGLVFNVSNITMQDWKAQIFPTNELCHVTLHSITIRYADGSHDTQSDFEKQVILEHGNHYFFGEKDHITVAPRSDKKAISIEVELHYLHLGKIALQSMAKTALDVKAWFYAQMNEQETAFAQRIEELSNIVKSKDFQIVEASARSEELKKAFVEYRNEAIGKVQALEVEIRQITQALASKETTVSNMASIIDKLNDKILQLEKVGEELRLRTNDKIHQLEKTIEEFRQKAEAGRREIEGYKSSLRKKDELVWETYAKSQKVEQDYHQSLRYIEDIKNSISYKLGWLFTSPFRLIYDLFFAKPINETKLWLAWQFVLTGIRMPGRMLSHINAKNIGTLRKALRNESPREIAGNLLKLLAGTNRYENTSPKESQPLPPPPTRAIVKSVVPAQQNGFEPRRDSWPAPLSTKRIVLFSSPNLPDFDSSSGGKRATRMLGLLAEECDVYAFSLGSKPEKYIRHLESLGVRVFRGNDFQEVKEILPRVDVLIFSFFYTYFDCGAFVSLYPNAIVIVDSVDVHWVRHERSRGLWPELTDDIIRKKKKLEIEVYEKAHVVWAVTQQDKEAILTEVPDADVRIVSNIHSPLVAEYRDPGNNNMLFMGGFAHYPNIIAAKELALNVLPKIRAAVDNAKLLIAGANAPQDIVDLGNLPGVEFLGFVEDSQLSELYRNAFLTLAPLQVGAGIKGKICEAISYKLPVVTNSIGNEGIGLVSGQSGIISDDHDELVALTIKALNREYDLHEITHRAQKCLEKLVGPNVVKKNMLDSLFPQEVSICIVTWNRQKLLQRCIESIENHTQGIRHRILVYSNGCTDGTREYLTAAAKINTNIVPILSDTNDVFVIPNNRMMQLFPNNDVVLLNNDTYVTEGWLSALRDAAYSSSDIGIAGAKLLYPDGKLQEFGSELYSNGTGRNIGKGDNPNKEIYQHPKFAGYVSGCVFYIKRDTIQKIGMFDEAFHPCYCEDSDYCYTAWENGIATIVTPDCVVYHDEGGTSGTDVNKGFKAYQQVNFEKFLNKHGGRLDEITSKIKMKNLSLQAEAVG